MKAETLISRMEAFSLKPADYAVKGVHVEGLLEKEDWRKAASALFAEGFYLVFVSAVSLKPAACIVCQFARHDSLLRVNLRMFALNDEAPTISDIFHGAAWYEREIHDFFGITFTGNEDMRPLILSELDAGFHPLRKGDAACLEAEKLGFIVVEREAESAAQETPSQGSPESA
ncbi:NADH-quinone oxidoreductase subunit C [Desulfobotulus sp.]|jgi:NADH-quinone oxidoreductase subunit C|uniref:NADH-quinone oxidoreductase subunit C n=1 Tax=Desulfobotulus sp. TaxID=1940337 RepID=UPI002A3683DB|nr:NADH-quinone oxidoreductase subunit C [Desulfobotulus sp.]MDY0164079.1 NADH-quinone oxidoreductase subunit C [Desulfobotulus sp.]